jgi:hypothetical protein
MGALSKPSVWSILATVSCAVAVSACGSSQTASKSTGSASHSRALQLANCMRAHGVPSFPDPPAGGGGVNLEGSGINPQSPAFQSARDACAKLAPGGGPGRVLATESQFLAALRFARCMRSHGFPEFPDPTRSDSPPGPILIVGPGLFYRVSVSFDPNAPIAKRAFAACGEQ